MDDAEMGALLVELRRRERARRGDDPVDGRVGCPQAWATASRARSASSWLAFHCRMPHATARRRVRLARARRSMPGACAAWDRGDIESAHVAALARVRSDATAEAFARDEEMLVARAGELRFDDFCRVVSYWHQHADPDGAEADAEKRFAGRVCELANGTAVTPGALVPWLTSADVERAVFDGPSRVIDVGATRRLFEGATRRAVEVRDRCRCWVPECDATARLQVDHVESYAYGGRTVQSNGRVACDVHNRARHATGDHGGRRARTSESGPSP